MFSVAKNIMKRVIFYFITLIAVDLERSNKEISSLYWQGKEAHNFPYTIIMTKAGISR